MEPLKQMTLTADIGHFNHGGIIIAGTGEATIDWGDEIIETITLPDTEYIRELLQHKEPKSETQQHRYEAAGTYTITITGDVALLRIYHNNIFHTLDVSHNSALKFLYCEDSLLTTLAVNQNPALTYLSCLRNNKLTSLDTSGCTALTQLYCGHNDQLTSLEVRGCTALTNLYCERNKLTSLDVSSCTALTELNCYERLTSLDVSGCAELICLACSWNQLTSLDVSSCTALVKLYCGQNQLTSLDVSNCIALTKLDCTYNEQLSSLVPNKLLKLEDLDYSHTKLPKYSYIYGDAKTGKIRATQKKLKDVFWVDKKMITEKMYLHFLNDIDEFAQSANNKDIVAVVYSWCNGSDAFSGQLMFMKDFLLGDYSEGKCLIGTDDELWKDVWEALDDLYRGDGTGSEYGLKRSIGGTRKMFDDEDRAFLLEEDCAITVFKRLLKENAFDKLNKTENFVAFVAAIDDNRNETAIRATVPNHLFKKLISNDEIESMFW